MTKSKSNLLVVGLILFVVTLSCKSFMPAKFTGKGKAAAIDFTAPGKGLDVRVQLDKKQTASGKVSPSGGSVSLTAADGSKFTLDVPPNALDIETAITMTAVTNLDGAPLDDKAPTAVQLEPSGLFFKEMATLTITPAKDIPIKNQIIFGYEGDGKDYHLAVIDPKSRDIKIKLMHFSGAGVGSGSDAAWAANLMVQARTAEARIAQRLGEYLQESRRKGLLEGEDSVDMDEVAERIRSALDQYEDQVVLKEIVAAELDCKHGVRAMQDLIGVERRRQVLGLVTATTFHDNFEKLKKIIEACQKPFRVAGVSNNVSFTGEICSLNKPFTLDATFPGGTATTAFAPSSNAGGATTDSGGGGGCDVSGGGNYTVALNEDGSGTLTWTTTDKTACPGGFSNSRTVTFTLPLQPAPDLACP